MTRVAIVGSHGKVGQQLMRFLYDRGDDFVGIVRGDEQAEDIYRLGGEGVLLDMESASADDMAQAISGCDAVVFTAGAGPNSGVERKHTVDYGASVLSADAAERAGIRRFVQVSAWGIDEEVGEDATDEWRAYVDAKREADAELRRRDLDWTILRPGTLTTEEGTGQVLLAPSVPRGSVSREDVAQVILAVLGEPRSSGRCWELTSGDTPIQNAVSAAINEN